MKKIIYILIAAIVFLNTACNEILDQMPHNQISGSSMWTTEEQADKGAIGVYHALQKPLSGSGIIGEGVNMGYYGYDAYGMTGQGSYTYEYLFSSNITPSSGRFSFPWKWAYTGIHRANEVITYVPNIAMDEKKKSRLVAEAKVLRAYFYSRLNEMYGTGGLGVPLYLEPISPADATKGQSPEAEIWAQIIKDLTEAIESNALENNYINGEGRVSKGAAYALRGRSYLITKEYGKAVSDFDQVGKCGYSLFPDYKQLFKEANERCQEIVMSIQYIDTPGYGTRVQKYAGAYQAGATDNATCWTDLQVTPTVVDLYEVKVDANTTKKFEWTDYFSNWNTLTPVERKVYFVRDSLIDGTPIHRTISNKIKTELASIEESSVRALYIPEGNEERILKAYTNRDPRLSYNVITPYSSFIGVNASKSATAAAEYVSRFPVVGKYFANEANAENNLRPGVLPSLAANASQYFYYMHRKFIGEGIEYKYRHDGPIDEPIIRYADVLLMWAEALVEMDDLSGAMAKVKLVRDRVNMPTMASNFADKNTARNYVRDERRREFVGEGINFFDEMRWRTLKETKFGQGYASTVHGTMSGRVNYEWKGDYWYTWPVPKTEIDMNPNLTKTPGWDY